MSTDAEKHKAIFTRLTRLTISNAMIAGGIIVLGFLWKDSSDFIKDKLNDLTNLTETVITLEVHQTVIKEDIKELKKRIR